MRVLGACSLGGAGHLRPLLPLLRAARDRGDDVLVIAPLGLESMVEEAGFHYVEGGAPNEELVRPIREKLPTAPPQVASVLANRDLFATLATAAMLPSMEELFDAWSPELIIREPCEYASAVVALSRRIPVIQVAISLAEAEAGSIAAATPALLKWRDDFVNELIAMPYVSGLPSMLDPSPFPTMIRCRESGVVENKPLPNWWNGNDGPLVAVTFGTVLGSMDLAADVFRVVLAALCDDNARYLLTVGPAFDPKSLDVPPPHIHIEQWVDQERVFAEAELVVCHGGSGTTYGALSHGLPLVLVPQFADQFENSRRVVEAGAGVVVSSEDGKSHGDRPPLTLADAPRITEAIEKVRSDPSFRDRAEEIGASMANALVPSEILASVMPPGSAQVNGT